LIHDNYNIVRELLECALKSSHEGPVRDLLRYKANINIQTDNGVTSLHYAVIHRKIDILQELINRYKLLILFIDYKQ
jgi:ankyrin repeat protein